MTDYVTKAAEEAEEYEKQRKQQAAEVIAQTNAAATTAAQAAQDKTGAAIRDERRSTLDTLDTAAVQKTRAGILSGCVSIPCRNIHAPAEIVDLKDVENVGKLLAAAAKIAL